MKGGVLLNRELTSSDNYNTVLRILDVLLVTLRLLEELVSEQRLRDGREHATKTRASNQEIIVLFAGLLGVKVQDLRRLLLAVNSVDGAPEDANIGRLEGRNVLESDPGLRGKLVACERFRGSNQVD